MEKKLTEPEFLEGFEEAIKYDHIYAVYQPQINHSTKRMIGAEALMRWKHPVFGVQMPGDFIPVLEKNNLIFTADLHIFELVCRFQRKCMDERRPMIPISVNMSRYDIYNKDYVGEIEKIRLKYDVPVEYLRIEITESSAIGGSELMKSVLEKLHGLGYLVEMDDFGSGYSSLNILKDLEVDIIKLDMRFLQGKVGGRGGAILGSVIQMANWLNTPVIAEGVESIDQADYMKSIGCNYIQGYLYSRPLEESDFFEAIARVIHEPLQKTVDLLKNMDASKFWNPASLETLIFSNFVGPACVFSYEDGKTEMLRVNDKYLREIGMSVTEKEIIGTDPWVNISEEGRRSYEKVIKRAIETGEEKEHEGWRKADSKCCGENRICVRSHIRVIGTAGKQYLIYALVQNVTAEKRKFDEYSENERRFKAAFEQANVYAWEWDIETKEMRPCFRCMRDLGLPPVVENYPEPAIEAGIFPPDYADMYRGWMKDIANGCGTKEGIIPLTVGRVPFYVRYTTEFDENGRPMKAYGSATLVVENKE